MGMGIGPATPAIHGVESQKELCHWRQKQSPQAAICTCEFIAVLVLVVLIFNIMKKLEQ